MLPFEIKEDMTTYIVISLAKLEVGVISSDGKSALPNVKVYYYLQKRDAAGNYTPVSLGGYNYFETDATGVGSVNLRAGTYIFMLDGNWHYDEKYVYNITVTPSEDKYINVSYDMVR